MIPVVRLTPQLDNHCEGHIDCNDAGIRALRGMIDGLLHCGDSSAVSDIVEVFAPDGEGFSLWLTLHPDEYVSLLEPVYTMASTAETENARLRAALKVTTQYVERLLQSLDMEGVLPDDEQEIRDQLQKNLKLWDDIPF